MARYNNNSVNWLNRPPLKRVVRTETPLLGKRGDRDTLLPGQAPAVEFDTLDFVQRFRSQITLTAMWATDDGCVFSDKESSPSARTPRNMADLHPTSATDIAYHVHRSYSAGGSMPKSRMVSRLANG